MTLMQIILEELKDYKITNKRTGSEISADSIAYRIIQRLPEKAEIISGRTN